VNHATDCASALREEYERLGEKVDHLSDLELLAQELQRAQTESRRHENAYNSLLHDQVKRTRSAYSAARRSAQESVTARAGIYLQAILRRSAQPINAVVYQAAQLPGSGRATAQQVKDLKAAAEQAQWSLSGMVSDPQAIEDAASDPGVQLVDDLNAEIRRLRELITGRGATLHADLAQMLKRESGGRCQCHGCELIRAMDDLHTVTDDAEAGDRS